MKVHIRAYGEKAYLVSAPELADIKLRRYLDRQLIQASPPELLEHVWGASNLLLIFESEVATTLIRAWFASIALELLEESAEGEIREVPVVYEGPDLGWMAKQTGLSCDQVIEIHSTPIYTVRMMGFSPGFPYLDGLDERLHFERRAQPRKRIAPGSVAIGGPHAGIYSVPSPGGWHILGHTNMELFKPEAARGAEFAPSDVFAFQPGERIRFMPV